MLTSSPSLVKNLLQERRRWKFQIKRGNREIGRTRQSQRIRSLCDLKPTQEPGQPGAGGMRRSRKERPQCRIQVVLAGERREEREQWSSAVLQETSRAFKGIPDVLNSYAWEREAPKKSLSSCSSLIGWKHTFYVLTHCSIIWNSKDWGKTNWLQ